MASAKSFAKCLAESLTKSLAETLSETLGETFGETFRARQAAPQSLGSDYMRGSLLDSPRLVFFYARYRRSTMDCKRDSFNGAPGEARETH